MYSVAYSGNLLSLIIGDSDTELFLELHDKLYGVKAVSAKIGGEGCGFGYLGLFNAQFVNDDSFYTRCNF